MADADEAPDDFREEEYLSLHPAIAQVVREGGFKSGLEHYRLHGRSEGRQYKLGAVPQDTPSVAAHPSDRYFCPDDLTVTAVVPTRIALIGSCLVESWQFDRASTGCDVDTFLVNNAAPIPDDMPEDAQGRRYDFQVIQLPLRAVMHDAATWRLPYGDSASYQRAFQEACQKLEFMLDETAKWNAQHGLLTFVSNFLTPQRNPNGCLFPKFDLRNPEYFVTCLNERMEALVRSRKNAYVLDIDRISASIGRRYVQDDVVELFSHNSVMALPGPVTSRMEPLAAMADHYDVRWPTAWPREIWSEVLMMYRTIRQVDAVKLVVVDLDDTLWNGVSGDLADISPMMVEGWPLGFAEALTYLRKRGILLAILSKNEESRIREIWPQIFGDRLRLEDFAVVVVNWRPKTEGMQEILRGVNLLPRNVVFIDDNPVERAAVKDALPGIRVLGRNPYYLRRILLWSSETQVPSVTEESGRRTEMIQAQLQRESERKTFSRQDFLMAAQPSVTVFRIGATGDRKFPRAFELINKTNQFNTTGRRWTLEECDAFLASGGEIFAFEAADRYTQYGLVGVVLIERSRIVQWVMSCRILGYNIEEGVMAALVRNMRARSALQEVTGELTLTDVNFPARDLFSRCGFADNGEGQWVLAPEVDVQVPEHLKVGFDQSRELAGVAS